MDKIDKNILNKPQNLKDQQQFVELEKETNSVCFYFNGFLSDKVILNIVEELKIKPDSPEILLLILKSDGGYANCCGQTIKSYILENTLIKELHVIINEYVKSAASVIALSSDKLYFIDKFTGMGCIDPRLPEWNYLSVFDKYGKDLLLSISKEQCLLRDIKLTDFKDVKKTFNLTHEAINNGAIFKSELFSKQFYSFMGLTDKIDYSIFHRKPILAKKLIDDIGINAEIIRLDSSLYKKVIHVIKDAMTIQEAINKKLDFFILGNNFVFY